MPDQLSSPSSAKTVANAIVQGIKEGKLDLPVMPAVASKILALTNDPNADMAELSKLIHGDQSIASQTLRIANSAGYASGEPIVSLQQAVTRLGMKLLGEIAIAVSIQSDIFKAPGFEKQIRNLLRHALAAGAYGREIARKRRRNVEGQFLCGLLHSVGQPICLQLVATAQARLGLALEDQELQQILASLSPKIATKVAIDWKLPKQLQVTTVYYHNYAAAPAFQDECAATYLSQRFADWIVNPVGINIIELGRDPVVQRLNLYQDDFQELLTKKDEVKAVVSAMEL